MTVQDLPPLTFVDLPDDLRAARWARRLVREAATPDTVMVEDAELLVSELVTNALRYSGRPLGIACRREGSVLTVWVRSEWFGGDLHLRPAHAPPEAEGGRGLMLVEAISHAWGVQTGPGVTFVWFSLRDPELP